MFYLILQNIGEEGNLLEESKLPFSNVKDCIEKIDEYIDADPRNIYASPKYLRWLGKDRFSLAQMGMPEEEELQGTSGWEVRGVIADPDDRRSALQCKLVAQYLGGIVGKEIDNIKKGRRGRLSRMTKAQKLILARQLIKSDVWPV